MYEVVCDPKADIPDRLEFLAKTHRRVWENGSNGGRNG